MTIIPFKTRKQLNIEKEIKTIEKALQNVSEQYQFTLKELDKVHPEDLEELADLRFVSSVYQANIVTMTLELNRLKDSLNEIKG